MTPGAGQVFAGQRRDPVQPRLDFAKQGHAPEHNPEDDQNSTGWADSEDKGAAGVNGKGEDQGAQHDKRAAQQQSQA